MRGDEGGEVDAEGVRAPRYLRPGIYLTLL
jgi:hypothetical protein